VKTSRVFPLACSALVATVQHGARAVCNVGKLKHLLAALLFAASSLDMTVGAPTAAPAPANSPEQVREKIGLVDNVVRLNSIAIQLGDYEVAMKQLEDYIKKYPKGDFIADAKYRYDVCKYAASLYEEVANARKAWETKFGTGNPMIGEVLEADALAGLGKDDEATATYIRTYKSANTDVVLKLFAFCRAEAPAKVRGAGQNRSALSGICKGQA